MGRLLHLLVFIFSLSFSTTQGKDISLFSGNINFIVPNEYIEIPNEDIGLFVESASQSYGFICIQK